ncbi:MAG: hypothetical protein HY392_04100 [Candidatus Diapherotrites archaeon]|nr:hypothetical protein [Candidatus Diapherotrites archaeon]
MVKMTKMISVMDETYKKLKNRKGEKSFSELFEELIDKKNERILKFAGALEKEWKDIDSQKFIASLRGSDKKNETRFKELEKHWK